MQVLGENEILEVNFSKSTLNPSVLKLIIEIIVSHKFGQFCSIGYCLSLEEAALSFLPFNVHFCVFIFILCEEKVMYPFQIFILRNNSFIFI